ncbi:MAG TPA: hypothetical protein VJ995_02310 [Geothermobacteraceae bacterium]|nr:hypothetical protein [Geothermobacteraceae bacterium]
MEKTFLTPGETAEAIVQSSCRIPDLPLARTILLSRPAGHP